MRTILLPIWCLCAAVLVVAAAQPIGFQPVKNPPAPVVSPPDPCLAYSSCDKCVVDTRCNWCLSLTTRQCRQKGYCQTGYTDCCILLKTCDSCIASTSATCGYCSDTSLCIPGNATEPRGTTCSAWHFSSCPSQRTFPTLSIVLVIMLTIGTGVVVLAVVLLILFIMRMRTQNKARKHFNQYFERPKNNICDFCQDGLATVFCKQCKLNLCGHCKQSEDLHPPGTNHTLQELVFDVQTDPNAETQPLRQGDAYTSFAGMIMKKDSSFKGYGTGGD